MNSASTKKRTKPAMSNKREAAVLYARAIEWLAGNSGGISRAELDSYLNNQRERPSTLEDLFKRLLQSLMDAGMRKRVIEGALPGQSIESFAKVTKDFSPVHTYAKYGDDDRGLLKDIKSKIKPTGQLRTAKKSLWPQYCKAMLSTAKFLQQFGNTAEFYTWVDQLNADPRLRIGLPLILSKELYGVGFALACNILIDLGYREFAKPDRHVKRILQGAGLLGAKASDYEALKVVFEICDGLPSVFPYSLDKALYLIGSGNYYHHKQVVIKGKRDRIGRFVKFLRTSNRRSGSAAG